jgi:hypothetical protein
LRLGGEPENNLRVLEVVDRHYEGKNTAIDDKLSEILGWRGISEKGVLFYLLAIYFPKAICAQVSDKRSYDIFVGSPHLI